MKSKKLLAIGLATILTLASSMTAFAADPADAPTGGTGSYEGYVEKTVVAGTYTTAQASSLAFAIDPQKIAAARLTGKTIDDTATVLFERKDTGKAKDYEGRSDSIIITSKSSVDVDTNVKITLDSLDGYTLVAKPADLTSDEKGDPQLYIAITDGTNTFAITDDKGATYSELIATVADSFEVKYDGAKDPKYTYVAKSDATFNNKEVYIIAQAAGKWTSVTTIPSLTVSYEVVEHVGDKAPEFSDGNAAGEIAYDAGNGAKALDEIKSITISLNGTPYDGYAKGASWAAASDDGAGTITLDSVFIGYWAAVGDTVEATITYTTKDDTSTEKTATVNVKTK